FLTSILSDFKAIADAMKADATVQQESSDLQKQLLGQIQDSRDSGSALALVALFGTGLDADSFALLDDYLKRLEVQQVIDNLLSHQSDNKITQQTDPSTVKVTPEWQAVE